MAIRLAMGKTKPDIIIEVNGKKIKITTITTLRTVVKEFTLDEPYESEIPGVSKKDTYITTLEGGNKLVTKIVSKNVVISSRELTDSGFVQTYYAEGGITGSRTFKKN